MLDYRADCMVSDREKRCLYGVAWRLCVLPNRGQNAALSCVGGSQRKDMYDQLKGCWVVRLMELISASRSD